MILVHITKNGVERVFIQAASESEQDQDLEIWPAVRRNLNRLNKALERKVPFRIPDGKNE